MRGHALGLELDDVGAQRIAQRRKVVERMALLGLALELHSRKAGLELFQAGAGRSRDLLVLLDLAERGLEFCLGDCESGAELVVGGSRCVKLDTCLRNKARVVSSARAGDEKGHARAPPTSSPLRARPREPVRLHALPGPRRVPSARPQGASMPPPPWPLRA